MPYKLIKGKNDLLSQRPEIAREAHGWNPEEYAMFSCKKMSWICAKGHQWCARVDHRTRAGSKCPYCQGHLVVQGESDLATKFPSIASEAYGWNPSEFKYGSNKDKKEWLCPNGHIYLATINQRTNAKSGCPQCANFSYKFFEDGWVYLIANNEEQKVGISNTPKNRLRRHKLNGWHLIELKGPMSGQDAWNIEFTIKEWLKNANLLIKGKQEIWHMDSMIVNDLADLGQRASLDVESLRLLS